MDEEYDIINGVRANSPAPDQEYVDGIMRRERASPPPPPPPTPPIASDYVDQVIRGENTRRASQGPLRPPNELDREGHYLRDPDPLDRDVGRNYSPPQFVGPPANFTNAPPGPGGPPGYNPATTNLDDQTPLDLTQRGTDTRDPDQPFKDVARGAEGEYTRLWTQAEESKARGDVGKGVFSYIGALGVKAGWGAFEGATFVARPWLWGGAVQGAGDLLMDKKFYDSEGKQTGSVRGQVWSQFTADPVGGLAFGLGNMAGGMAVSEGAGKFADMAWGKAGKVNTLTDVVATTDDAGKTTIQGSVASRKVPRGVVDFADDSRPNRVMVISQEEAVTTSSRVRSGLDTVINETDSTRVPSGPKRGLILDLDEGSISKLGKGEAIVVDDLKASLQETPKSGISSKSWLDGVTDFKETQVGQGSRAGAMNYARAGELGLGMDDAWMGWKTGAKEGIMGSWDLEKGATSVTGTPWENFSGKVVGGAKVVKQEATGLLDDFDTGVQRPTGGPKTPLGDLSRPSGWPSKTTQLGEVGDVQRMLKSGGTGPAPKGGVLSGGAGGAGGAVKASTVTTQASQLTGAVTFTTPVASSWGGAGAVGSGLNLLGRARSRLDVKPSVDDYLDSSTRQKVRPVVSFEPYTDRQSRIIPKPITDQKPKDDQDTGPLEDHYVFPKDDHRPKDPGPDQLQDHWVIQDEYHPPPPPDPIGGGGGGGGGGSLIGAFGPGGGLWGGPRKGVGSRSKKKTYQVADPMKMIGGSTPTTKKARRKAWGKSPLEMID